MRSIGAPAIIAIVCLISLLTFISPLNAQDVNASLSGAVTDPSGKPVSAAQISIKNLATGQITNTVADPAGHYIASKLAAGDYEVAVSAAGFDTKTEKITLVAGVTQTLDFRLAAGLSLEDLGISQQQAQGSAREQARLNKRSHMLQVHQRLGLITIGPLAATVLSGAFAGGKVTSSTNRDLHAALGSATAGLYFASAYYAIFAPKIPGTKTEGPIRWHKALAWIHGPGMILTPILGEMAFAQRSKGERVHGIAHYHGQVAIVTSAAYGLAILSVSIHSGQVSHAAHAFLRLFHSGQDVSGGAQTARVMEAGP